VKHKLLITVLLVAALEACFCTSASRAEDQRSVLEVFRAKKSIIIDKPCPGVWSVISDFSGIAKWYSGFKVSTRIKGVAGQVGEVRGLTRSTNGQLVHEELIYIDPQDMELAYTHTFNGPVKESIAIVGLTQIAANQCLVSWGNVMKLNQGQDPVLTVKRFNDAYSKVLSDLKVYLE